MEWETIVASGLALVGALLVRPRRIGRLRSQMLQHLEITNKLRRSELQNAMHAHIEGLGRELIRIETAVRRVSRPETEWGLALLSNFSVLAIGVYAEVMPRIVLFPASLLAGWGFGLLVRAGYEAPGWADAQARGKGSADAVS
jgi:hypothetical protein